MKYKKIVIVEVDDWTGLYIYGKCVWQHHEFDGIYGFIKLLKENNILSVKFDDIDEAFLDIDLEKYYDRFPDTLEELIEYNPS